MKLEELDDILTPDEVAQVFRVQVKTVIRWAQSGELPSFHTPGGKGRGHRRFRKTDVLAVINGEKE